MDNYQKIVKEIERLKPGGDQKQREWVQKYLGSDKKTRCIKTGVLLSMAKKIAKEIDVGDREYLKIIESLYLKAKSFEEIQLAGILVGLKSSMRKNIDLDLIDRWLLQTHGWAEGDILCQSNFSAEEILARWVEWKRFLLKMAKSKNIQQRRASLVLLCNALRESNDKRLSNLALLQVNKLKYEKEILITKAVSWILRSMVKNHKELVGRYLEENKETMPKIAYRETFNKVTTGKKNSRIIG